MYKQLKTDLKPLIITLSFCCTGSALAVDGVIEINQARALAGAVTASDTPGFPVTLDQSGSYRLTGKLTVPDENTNGINITANDVTVDLNGFGIFGPTVCTGRPVTSCTPIGTGIGIFNGLETLEGGTILNGTVRGMGNRGIGIRSRHSSIRGVKAVENGSTGIVIGVGSLVTGNVASGNGSDGINASLQSLVKDNIANENGRDGISAGRSSIIGNLSHFNAAIGIHSGENSIVKNNTVNHNGGRGILTGSGGLVTDNVILRNTGLGIDTLESSAIFAYSNNALIGNTNDANNEVKGGANSVEIGTNLCSNDTTCP